MEQIEHGWYVVLGERADDEEDRKRLKESSGVEKKAKELVSVTLMGSYMGRELGFTIPEVSHCITCFHDPRVVVEQGRQDFANPYVGW